jgi:Ni/Fe-hydrogenase subunit HybB-like protein
MGEINTGNEPLIFKELPKEQRKALQKEFSQTAESKKMSKIIIIVAVILAVVVIAGAIIAVTTGHEGFYGAVPVYIFCAWPAIISQQKFEKWLAVEKNIVMKRKK